MVACLISGLLPDSPPPDESLLSDITYPDPNGSNSYPLLVKASDAATKDKELIAKLVSSNTASCQEVTDAINKYRESFSLIEEASDKDYYFNTYTGSETFDDRVLIGKIHLVMNLSSLRMKPALMKEPCATDCGYDCAMKYYKLAHQINSGYGMLSEHVLGKFLKGNSFSAINKLLPVETTNLKEKSLIFEEILNRGSVYNGLSTSMKNEYKYMKYYVPVMLIEKYDKDDSTTEKIGCFFRKIINKLFFKINRTLAMRTRFYNNIIINLGKVPLNSMDKYIPQRTLLSELLHGNIGGYLTTEDPWDNQNDFIFKIQNIAYYCDLLDSTLSLKIALTAYEQENGTLPETLDGLSPEYLKVIPNDPFDGKRIRYNREKRIVYSVGNNFVDDGGMSSNPLGNEPNRGKGQHHQKDIVLNLKFYCFQFDFERFSW